ncbi:MAG: sigma-54 dependent transcriptional regulator [Wenzhouxiangellaceae bacterium]|nr:sigma-54 dependent transcriptional regulator [Wenzhouxiangellaceae bacterium]
MTSKVLIVDDETDIRELIGEILADEGFEPVLAANAEEARERRSEHHPDLILLDVWMPDSDGISLLREWREADQLRCPVVMISGHGSVEAAVEATRHGAFDFIEKPVSMARLMATIRKALASAGRSGSPIGAEAEDEAGEPVGRSEAAERLRSEAERVAELPGHLLICGEPGTGRAALAAWIRTRGRRRDADRASVVCGGDAERLDELAGRAEDGAFAGKGLTLLLTRFETVSDPERHALERLLALTGQGLGIRITACATPRIDRAVADGDFDASLFHAVGELRIDVPALRDRREDIPDLVRHYTERLPTQEGLDYRPIPVPVQNRLRQHDWPGNLRELANVIRQLLSAGGDEAVTVDEVDALLARSAASDDETIAQLHSPFFEMPLREAREAFERQYLIANLKRVGGSVGQLAEAVEMERTHLYRKLRQLGVDPKQVQDKAR